jgi:hypothetical protein
MLQECATPTLWMETDPYGRIESIAPETARLLGLSTRGAYARDFRLFFPTSFAALTALVRKAGSEHVETALDLYPRDRKPVPVLIRIESSAGDVGPSGLRWTLERL